ncbi:MAG: hypothetical protein LBL46_04500 [Rickettsiales bacterium]|jgi:hypothetical protein|nr:hypothetical protein [Rickettsiales bacterium]
MKITIILCSLFSVLSLGACCRCEVEPLVEENHKLVVPPDFGKQPGK